MITRDIAHAMTTQLNRVNRFDDDPRDEIARLQGIVSSQARQIAELKQLVASYEDGGSVHLLHDAPAATISIGEAAKRAGVSVSTAWRYCQSGYWQARSRVVHQHAVWDVLTNQPLHRKPSNKKRG